MQKTRFNGGYHDTGKRGVNLMFDDRTVSLSPAEMLKLHEWLTCVLVDAWARKDGPADALPAESAPNDLFPQIARRRMEMEVAAGRMPDGESDIRLTLTLLKASLVRTIFDHPGVMSGQIGSHHITDCWMDVFAGHVMANRDRSLPAEKVISMVMVDLEDTLRNAFAFMAQQEAREGIAG